MICFLVFLSLIAASLTGSGLEIGAEAPQFTLPGSDGETYSLEQFLGKKPVVVAWFPKAFTGG